MSSTRPSRKRTVFSLTPKELFELRQLNINVNVTVPPRRPLRSDGFESYHEYSYDLGIYERYRDNHARAKYE